MADHHLPVECVGGDCEFSAVIGMVLFTEHRTGSLAYGKTVEAGDSSSSWSGTGEFLELGNGEQVVNGISGTTPFQASIIFELQEGKNGQAIGYAV